MHKAKAILDEVVTAVTGLSTTGSNVEQTRGYPKHSVPAITVRVADITRANEISNAFLDSFVEIETIYHVAGSAEDLDDQLLQIDAEVYAAVMADRTLNGQAVDVDPDNYSPESGIPEAELPTASAVRRWRIFMRHSINDTES